MARSGILLFAHGARDPNWAKPFEAAAALLRKQSAMVGGEVVLAFLEFMSPNILEAGKDLAERGCEQVTVVPLFLGAGGHVRKDLPKLLGDLSAQFPSVQWTLSPAVGETDILIQALADAAWSLAQPPQTNA
jgi:sirohydrochlorin cobaltochelatase